MRLLSSGVLIAAIVLNGGQVAAQEMAFRGLGTDTCENFLKLVDAEAGGGAKQAVVDIETIYYTWAQGFWTGMNGILLHTGQKSTDLNDRPVQQHKDDLYGWCAGNPKETYIDAALDLFIRMRTQQGLPMWNYVEP